MSHAKAIKAIKLLASIGEKSPKSLYFERVKRNIRGIGRHRTIDYAWNGFLIGILTTQQRSTGKSNRVRELLDSRTLTWKIASKNPNSISRIVKGFNYNNRKMDYLRSARQWLLDNVEEIGKQRRILMRIPVERMKERYSAEVEAADFLSNEVRGIGPKQSRNFWQYLGYSAWIIPFDSRIRSILELPPFNVDPVLTYLEAEQYVLKLCREAETFPCLLDASLFDLEGLMRSYVGLPHY